MQQRGNLSKIVAGLFEKKQVQDFGNPVLSTFLVKGLASTPF